MDLELMQLLARFKLRLLRTVNQKMDTYRFIADREYAAGIFWLLQISQAMKIL